MRGLYPPPPLVRRKSRSHYSFYFCCYVVTTFSYIQFWNYFTNFIIRKSTTIRHVQKCSVLGKCPSSPSLQHSTSGTILPMIFAYTQCSNHVLFKIINNTLSSSFGKSRTLVNGVEQCDRRTRPPASYKSTARVRAIIVCFFLIINAISRDADDRDSRTSLRPSRLKTSWLIFSRPYNIRHTSDY